MGRKFKEAAAGSFSPILKSTAMLLPPAPIFSQPTPEVEDTTVVTSVRLPSLSEASFGDLTSLLVKTGRAVEAEGTNELEQVNVTEQLGGQAANHDSMDETMEELESLMLRLEQVGEVGAITNNVRT